MQNLDANPNANPPISVFAPLLQDLKAVLKAESEHLTSGRVDMLEVFARKKMQALANINIFTRNDPHNNLAKANEVELKEIDLLLRDNMKKLNFRIEAIGEITETINSAVREAEGDGTYDAGDYHVRRRA